MNHHRKPIIAANWKMFKTVPEARETAVQLKVLLDGGPALHSREVVVCPPFTALAAVNEALSGSGIQLGGQNLHWEAEGAFTGEISAGMLLDCGCRYVLLGHSERRQFFLETDEAISRKLRTVLSTPLIPVLCVGESLAHREAGRVEAVIEAQLAGALAGVEASRLGRLVVAYEPVWAIGTGKTATPAIADQVHGMIREWLARHCSADMAAAARILYGGSVKPANAGELMARENIDGALVGGASLDADSFTRIVEFK